jgi:hypothetical protein
MFAAHSPGLSAESEFTILDSVSNLGSTQVRLSESATDNLAPD